MSTVVQMPTDRLNVTDVEPNDKVWEEITPHEPLQQLLYTMLCARGTDAKIKARVAVEEWLENNLKGCDAEVYGATRIDQASYCDDVVAPGHGDFCDGHMPEPDDDGPDDEYESFNEE